MFNFPVGITIIVLNIPLFILATLKIGKTFLLKTLLGTISLSVFIDIFEKMQPITHDKILACVYGGILTGLGTALILRAHSSTGGSDLAGNIIKEYKPMAFFGILAFIIGLIGIILTVPPFIGFFETGQVAKFPSLIFGCFLITIALLNVVTGVILEVIAKKHRQLYELYLNMISKIN